MKRISKILYMIVLAIVIFSVIIFSYGLVKMADARSDDIIIVKKVVTFPLTSKNECGIFTPYYQCMDKIIKQNDWIICSQLYKPTRTYYNDDDWGKKPDFINAYDKDDLIKICGAVP